MNRENLIKIIDNMDDVIGQAKQARLRAIVRSAPESKLDLINLGKLAKIPLKDMAKYKKSLWK